MMNISKRLKAVAAMVSDGLVTADIGTDHAYIPIYLVTERGFLHVMAMDVREGPLQHARENIARYGIEDKIDIRLSDGLCSLAENEAEAIIISGMGGLLMNRIIKEGIKTALNAKELILSPHSDIPKVREFLKDNGFMIIDEDCIYDDKKYYFIIKAKKGKMGFADEMEARYGNILFDKKCDDFKNYLIFELNKKNAVLKRMNASDNEKRKNEIMKEIALTEKCLARFEDYEGLRNC